VRTLAWEVAATAVEKMTEIATETKIETTTETETAIETETETEVETGIETGVGTEAEIGIETETETDSIRDRCGPWESSTRSHILTLRCRVCCNNSAAMFFTSRFRATDVGDDDNEEEGQSEAEDTRC